MKMKRVNLFLLAACALSTYPDMAQTPPFSWAKNIGSTSIDRGNSVATDGSGNTYITGYFTLTTDFDPGTGVFNLTPVGGANADIFVAKFDATGSFLWAKNVGSTGSDMGKGIAAEPSGNLYVTGFFEQTADFDPGAGVADLTSAGFQDVFVLKLDANGNYLWAKAMGSTGISDQDNGNSIAVDASGNVLTTGYFHGTADFDPGTGVFNLNAVGGSTDIDIFVSKLDGSGNFVWAKSMGSTTVEIGRSITVNTSGDVLVTGYFNGITDFDPGAGTFNMSSAGSSDIFICKLNSAGNFTWAKQIGSSSNDQGASISTDPAGNVYTTGFFYGTVDFDPGTGTSNLISTTATNTAAFVSKLDGTGTFAWAKFIPGGYFTRGQGIQVNSSGHVFVTGLVDDTDDGGHIFVSELDQNGVTVFLENLGGNGEGFSIRIDASGNLHVTGELQGTADFDAGAGVTNLTSNGSSDIFLLKWGLSTATNGPPAIAPTTAAVASGGIATVDLNGLISDPDSNFDLSSLIVLVPPTSGAVTSINLGVLTIDYTGLSFSGLDMLTVQGCDLIGACAQQLLTVEVGGGLFIYNAVSPNGDGKNDTFVIQHIETLPETQKNKVTIFNRWGTAVFEVADYNNSSNVFKGLSTGGGELPSGTYYYTIEFTSGEPKRTGFISLRR